MSRKGKWAKICRIKKNQDCFSCSLRQEVKQTKRGVRVSCDIGGGTRTLWFGNNLTPYCGAYKGGDTDS